MHTKRLFIDLETTGSERLIHGVHQISGVIEIDGKVEDTFDYHMRPFTHREIDLDALEVCGLTYDDIMNYPPPRDVFEDMLEYLFEMSDDYYPHQKFTVVGYSVNFDMDFITKFFLHNHSLDWGILQNWKHVDVLSMVRILVDLGDKRLGLLSDHKLKTVCDALDIPLNPHNGLDDVIATRTLYHTLLKRFTLNKA